MARILGVDGNSMVHRAWHGGTDQPTDGWVSARVVSMFAQAWPEGPYDAIYVGFDGQDNIRKIQYEGYKAHRAEKDPGLVDALARAQDDLADCGFTVDCREGIEADDLMAAVVREALAAGHQCDVLSSDRDLLALITDGVRLLRPRSSMRDLQPYDAKRVVAEYGVEPHQYTAYAALRGDASDGLAGVNGIGPRAAAKLLRRYDTLDGVYEAVQWQAPKQEAALRRGRDIAYRNLGLMSPIEGLKLDLDAILGQPVDPVVIDSAMVPLGHGWAAGSLRRAIERPPMEPNAPLPDDEDEPFLGLDETDPLAGTKVSVGSTEGEQVGLF